MKATNLKIKYLLIGLLFFNTLEAQELLDKTLIHDGENRAYKVYIPANYDGDSQVPLMFNFHGAGLSAELQLFWVSDMRPVADTAGFILVYPEGLVDEEGLQVWNIAGPSSDLTTDDLGFTEAMIDALAAEYMIDESRVYACGYSNGGFFSFDLACRLSDRIAAVGSVAGTMLADTYNDCTPSHPTPVISIHGTDDFVVAYDGFPPFSWSLDEVNEYWVDYNNTESNPSIIQMPDLNSADGSTVEYYAWNNGDDCVAVEHYKVIGGGHDWPDVNGDPTKTNVDVSANTLIWDFVSKYDINGLIDCNATSLEESFNDEASILLFPNPVKDHLRLKMDLISNTAYQIYSTDGTIMKSGIIKSNNQTIRLSDLPSGLYFIKLGNRLQKFVKEQ